MGLATGFQYFYEEVLGLNPNAVICAFDFHTQSGDQIVNQPWITGINGTVNNSGNFYAGNSGSGAFNGGTYIYLNSGLNLDSWTIFLTYQRGQSGRNDILVSSLSGDNITNGSGIILGINEANKLYLEFGNDISGPQVVTFSTIISDKNMISVSKSDSTVFFNYFDTNSKTSIVEQFSIFQNYFLNSTNWSIGGKPSGNYWANGNNFSGFIDNFVLISGTALDLAYQNLLFSGFYAEKYAGSGYTSLECTDISFITGISTGLSSGVIGYQVIQTSNIIDSCGRNQPVFTWSGMSGIISGEVFVTISGQSCAVNSGVTGAGIWIDVPYLYGFGMNQVSLLWQVESGDLMETFALTGLFSNTTRNKIAQWNALEQRFFVDSNNYTSGDLSVYLNTQLTLESGFLSYQDGYDTKFILTGDYFITGLNKLESTGRFQVNDVILYDITNKTYNSRFFDGNSGAVAGLDFSNSMVFVNGQKIFSGVDYLLPNILLNSYGSGTSLLTVTSITGNSIYDSGYFTGFLGFNSPFLRNSSMVFYNGMRQIPNNQYVENATFDLLSSGAYLEPLVKNPLYVNSDDFLNYPTS